MIRTVVCSLLLLSTYESIAFGTLFTSPDERNRLNLYRNDDKVRSYATSPEITDKIHLNGFVVRKEGKRTVWINNRSSEQRINNRQISIHSVDKEKVRVTLDGWSRPVNLRPGQAIDLSKGQIQEGFSVKKELSSSASNNSENSETDSNSAVNEETSNAY